jgi:hypothetical protein
LGLTSGLRFRPFGSIGVVLLQLVIGAMNFTVGLILLTYYTLSVNAGNQLLGSSTLLTQISLFVFIFGLLSFMASILGATPLFSAQSFQPQASRMESQETAESPVRTRQYVAQYRQTMLQQAKSWSEIACPNCSRGVSAEDNFCDACGMWLRGSGPAQVVAE